MSINYLSACKYFTNCRVGGPFWVESVLSEGVGVEKNYGKWME